MHGVSPIMVAYERVAVVTGGASGIGRATVERFVADESYDAVACLDLNPNVHDEFDDPSVWTYQVDVSDHDAISDAVDAIEEDGNIEAIVNNAGLSRYFWIGDLEPEEWHDLIDINLTSQYSLAHAAGPLMYERERGYIVNVSSGAGKHGSASGGVHYSAAKAGIFGLTRGLAKQLSPHVHVNCVVPGLVETPLATDSELWTEEKLNEQAASLPLEKLGDPDEIARVIHFLCGPGAAYMTGSLVTVDGGSQLN